MPPEQEGFVDTTLNNDEKEDLQGAQLHLTNLPDNMPGVEDHAFAGRSAAPQAAAVAAKDAWYTGPDTISQNGKTYRRLPSLEYATARGPCKENSEIVRAIHDRSIYAKDMKWILPIDPELVFNATVQTTVNYSPAHPQYGIQCVPHYNGPICNQDGKEVTADVVDKVKATVMPDRVLQNKIHRNMSAVDKKYGGTYGTSYSQEELDVEMSQKFCLGDSSAEQPILFIDKRVYDDVLYGLYSW